VDRSATVSSVLVLWRPDPRFPDTIAPEVRPLDPAGGLAVTLLIKSCIPRPLDATTGDQLIADSRCYWLRVFVW